MVNAGKLKFSGGKYKKKVYYWHTGYPGGLKTATPYTLDGKGKFHEVNWQCKYNIQFTFNDLWQKIKIIYIF